MTDYPLRDYAELITLGPVASAGIIVHCPNCGANHAAWFENPIGGDSPRSGVSWKRTGETLETLTLHPSFHAIDHYHSWICNGMLCVDSEFKCKPRAISA
jgi:hypothetical protein